MKKKILLAVIPLVAVVLVVALFLIQNSNGYRTIDQLLEGFEKAVNNCDEKAIKECYPDFMQEYLPTISHNSITEFHEKVGDISFEIIGQNSCDSDKIQDAQDEINKQYDSNIKLQDYQIIVCKYHKDFSEISYEAIKINNKWYFWLRSYIPEPISYFTE